MPNLTKYTNDVEIIQGLSNKPNEIEGLTAEQLKKKFDDNSINLKAYLNETLTPEIDANMQIATQEEAEVGANNTKLMTPLRTKQLLDINKNVDGLIPIDDTLSFASADSSVSTYILNTIKDLRNVLSKGMKMQLQQEQALTSYWPLDANSNDLKNNLNGTDVSISYAAGKFGNAAVFNGATSAITLADTSLLKPSGSFTIGLWFKCSVSGEKGFFQSFSVNPNRAGFWVGTNSLNKLVFDIGINADTFLRRIEGNTIVNDGSWHYLIATINNNYGQIYLDGKLEASGYLQNPVYAATNYVRIGCLNVTGSNASFMNGSIDDVFLINGYALDEQTIKKQYDAQVAQGTGNVTIDKWGFVTDITSNQVKIYCGTDFAIMNSAVSNPKYSMLKNPYSFNNNPDKWSALLVLPINITISNPAIDTYYTFSGASLYIPAGLWKLYYAAHFYLGNGSATALRVTFSLSSLASSASDNDLTRKGEIVATGYGVGGSGLKDKSLNVKTLYQLIAKAEVNSYSSMILNGGSSPFVIKAVCNYL